MKINILLITIPALLIVALFIKNKIRRNKEIKIETILKANGIIEKDALRSVNLKKLTIKNIIKSTDKISIRLFQEIFQRDDIVELEVKKPGEIQIKTLQFKKVEELDKKEQLFIGKDINNKNVKLNTTNLLLQIQSGGGKTTIFKNLINNIQNNQKLTEYEIIIADSHGSFIKEKINANVILYDLSDTKEFQAFTEEIKSILKQQSNDKIKRYIFFDEIFENLTVYTNDVLKKEKLELIQSLNLILTSGRKYDTYLFAATQTNQVSNLPIHSTLFTTKIYKYSPNLVNILMTEQIGYPVLQRQGIYYIQSPTYDGFIKIEEHAKKGEKA